MKPEEIVALLKEEFPDDVMDEQPEGINPSINIKPESFLKVATFCAKDDRLKLDYLRNQSAADYLITDPKLQKKLNFEPHLEVVYHLFSFTHHHHFTLKVPLPRWKDDKDGQLPELSTASGIWSAADWHEREIYDLMGINFVGHPNLARILCPEDWVGHPLRKDYEFPKEFHGIRC